MFSKCFCMWDKAKIFGESYIVYFWNELCLSVIRLNVQITRQLFQSPHISTQQNYITSVSVRLKIYFTYIRFLQKIPWYPGAHPFKQVPFVWKQSCCSRHFPQAFLHSFPNVPPSHTRKMCKSHNPCTYYLIFSSKLFKLCSFYLRFAQPLPFQPGRQPVSHVPLMWLQPVQLSLQMFTQPCP